MAKHIFIAITAMIILAVSCRQHAQNRTTADMENEPQQEVVQEANDMNGISNPAPPPPEIIVGTWKAPVKRGHVAYMEIFEDGMAGLYLGDANSDQLYEIYRGTVLSVGKNPNEISMEMEFELDWYIYESEDGSSITGVPDSYKGIYTLRHYWEVNKQMLHLTANNGADPLFGKKELIMEWTRKTANGDSMTEVNSVR